VRCRTTGAGSKAREARTIDLDLTAAEVSQVLGGGRMSETIRLRGDAVEWREVDGEIVALDRPAGEYVAVTGSGALLWPLLLAGTTRAALAHTLEERFGLAPGIADGDVDRFVDSLAARGLLDRP